VNCHVDLQPQHSTKICRCFLEFRILNHSKSGVAVRTVAASVFNQASCPVEKLLQLHSFPTICEEMAMWELDGQSKQLSRLAIRVGMDFAQVEKPENTFRWKRKNPFGMATLHCISFLVPESERIQVGSKVIHPLSRDETVGGNPSHEVRYGTSSDSEAIAGCGRRS
jgi:hypothetical protein